MIVIRTADEIQVLLEDAQEIDESGEADGYVNGVLDTLRWLTDPKRNTPALYEDDDSIPDAEEEDDSASESG